MSGIDRFEARIDYKYRFTFNWENDEIIIISVGPHDVGLGKR
jgi:plasmid maintenance system killer protein